MCVAAPTIFDETDFTLKASFAGTPKGVAPFRIRTGIDDVVADASAGVEVLALGGTSLKLFYEGRLGDTIQENVPAPRQPCRSNTASTPLFYARPSGGVLGVIERACVEDEAFAVSLCEALGIPVISEATVAELDRIMSRLRLHLSVSDREIEQLIPEISRCSATRRRRAFATPIRLRVSARSSPISRRAAWTFPW